jgi:membrane-associated protease RseP (regulator of RpoE activity)
LSGLSFLLLNDDQPGALDMRIEHDHGIAPDPVRRFPLIHVLLLAATGVTTSLAQGPAFGITLMTILLTHEAGHYVMCRHHRVNASLPYFLPAPPFFLIGTFGAFIRIRSRFPNRRALFDIGAGGPWAGFVVAVVATVIGLRLSTVMPQAPGGPLIELGDSFLTAWLTRAVLHTDPATVMLHPVAFAGWCGLFVTSLNLLPAGQLDGGHVLYAAIRRSRLVPATLLAFLVWLAWRGSPSWMLWAVIVATMTGLGHPPTIDDGLPLDRGRRVGAVLSLVVLVLTFVVEPVRVTP